MISNQILQNTIEGIKSISRVDLHVADTDGKIVATTSQAGDQFGHAIMSFVASPADSQSVQGYQFFKVYDENQLELILIAQGSSDDVFMVGKMAAFQIQNLLVAYKERYDKDNFIKNLLLDNLLLVDIYNCMLMWMREGVSALLRQKMRKTAWHWRLSVHCLQARRETLSQQWMKRVLSL